MAHVVPGVPGTRFSKHYAMSKWNEEHLRFEADAYELEVIGEIPSTIHGAFYRVQPDHAFPPVFAETEIPLNGDDNVSSFYIKDGHVDFKRRYVRTPKLFAEREARRALFGRYRNKYTDDPRVQNILKGTTANTHVVFHDNKLMALKEDARPMELGPITLETLGYDETLDYQLLGVIPRRGTKPEDAKWFKTPQGCCSHTINAYEEDGKLVLDANVWTDAHFPFFPNTKGERFFTDPRKVTAPILRYRFDPNANTDKMIHPEGVFVEGVNEFGRIDDRLLGKKYSRVWILKVDPTHQVKLNDHDAAQGNVGFNTLVCYNFDTGELQSYRHEDDTTFQEPVFVPRHEGAD
ncbi:Hypothetical protein NCS54_00887000 [Fusarium falciforme]|uniref:Hypothetical protein n=1 Tax=Fusarium falciforme TaxID=195108 RepID=UPI002301C5C4|nr:Hypothetical protein NCS54_00887000 [Fusarium falciforme]WAO91403.1 Hypothetical protein NCS54_00887000 [Fusarium falciforme]